MTIIIIKIRELKLAATDCRVILKIQYVIYLKNEIIKIKLGRSNVNILKQIKMGVSLYLVFYNKFLRPTKQYKLILLALVFLAYLFMGAYVFREMNLGIELRERAELLDLKHEFLNQHPCISREGFLNPLEN